MSRSNSRICGLYAVTPDTLDPVWLVERVEQAILGGARVLQFRSKHPDRRQRARLATQLIALCRRHGTVFIVNDDVELASELGADGVHLGRDDAPLAPARARLGSGMLIGASCYDDLALAQRCVDSGADYLAFGSFFASAIKPSAARPSLGLLREARRRWDLPLVAIGGITLDNASQLLDAGADALAVITALFSAADTGAAARAFTQLFAVRISSTNADAIA